MEGTEVTRNWKELWTFMKMAMSSELHKIYVISGLAEKPLASLEEH